MRSKPEHALPNTLYLSLVTVDPQSSVPLYRQIYQGLREAIANGRLSANTRLPSTRDLAEIWGVSRNTLRNAFDQLIAEGYIEAVVGRGTFVVPQETVRRRPPRKREGERIRPISILGQHLEFLGKNIKQTALSPTAFDIGMPDFDLFPHKIWSRTVHRCLRQNKIYSEQYVNGLPVLREAVASYLVSARGVRCSAEQVDIVPGSVCGMYVIALSLLNAGDPVWMENPVYRTAHGLALFRSAKPVPIPVDDQGINIDAAIAAAPNPRLAWVTPSHQYPLGATMSLARRQQLLDYAADNQFWILEDDYDSEFRYDSPPHTALQGLDHDQRVVYTGTFSKLMFPGLRLGYVVLPPDLVDVYTGIKAALSFNSSTLLQEAVAQFMLDGHFVRHIRRMREAYRARRDALVATVERHMSGILTLGATDCGMHIVCYLDEAYEEAAVVAAAQRVGMAVGGLSNTYIGEPVRQGLIIGFTNVRPEEIDHYFRLFSAELQQP